MVSFSRLAQLKGVDFLTIQGTVLLNCAATYIALQCTARIHTMSVSFRLALQHKQMQHVCCWLQAYQLFKARASGADAVLLIAAVLPNSDLEYLMKCARSIKLQCLIEVRRGPEAARCPWWGSLTNFPGVLREYVWQMTSVFVVADVLAANMDVLC
jgi:hypothetical protein